MAEFYEQLSAVSYIAAFLMLILILATAWHFQIWQLLYERSGQKEKRQLKKLREKVPRSSWTPPDQKTWQPVQSYMDAQSSMVSPKKDQAETQMLVEDKEPSCARTLFLNEKEGEQDVTN